MVFFLRKVKRKVKRIVEDQIIALMVPPIVGVDGRKTCKVCKCSLQLVGGMVTSRFSIDFYDCPLCGCEYEVKNKV